LTVPLGGCMMKSIFRLWLLFLVIGSVSASRSFGANGWFWQNPRPQGNPLFSVSVLDANTVIAVGDVGTVIKTTDGGETWTAQPPTAGTPPTRHGVSYVDADTATAVGACGTILRTTDGGATCASQTSGTTMNLSGVSFVNANTGTAVGAGGTILRTT